MSGFLQNHCSFMVLWGLVLFCVALNPVKSDEQAGCNVINGLFSYETSTRYRTALFPLPMKHFNNTLAEALVGSSENQLSFLHGPNSLHLEYTLHDFCIEKRRNQTERTKNGAKGPSESESCAFAHIDTATILAKALQGEFSIDSVLKRYFRMESIGEFVKCLPETDVVYLVIVIDFFGSKHNAIIEILEEISRRNPRVRVLFGARSTTAFFSSRDSIKNWKVFSLEPSDFAPEVKTTLLEWPKENKSFRKRYITQGPDNNTQINIDRLVNYYGLPHLFLALDFGGIKAKAELMDQALKALTKEKNTKASFTPFHKKVCEFLPYDEEKWRKSPVVSRIPSEIIKAAGPAKEIEKIVDDLVQGKIMDSHPKGIGFVSEFDHEIFCGFVEKEENYKREIKEAKEKSKEPKRKSKGNLESEKKKEL